MKASRYVAEGIFLLTAVFYGASSLSLISVAEKPELRIFPEGQNIRIPSGIPFSVRCSAFGGKVKNFTRMVWVDPRGEVIPEGIYIPHFTQVDRSYSSVRLMFYSPQRPFSGTYTCLAEYNETLDASNPDGVVQVEAQVNITVRDKPRVSTFENVTVEEGRKAVLRCSAKSYPIPNITIWKADDPYFAENEEGRIEVKYMPESYRNTVTFIINQVNRSDEGHYYCAAEANGYYTNESAYLEVQFAPYLTAPALKVVMPRWSDFANLTCTAEANPPANISWEFEKNEIHPEYQYTSMYGRTVFGSIVISRSNATNNHSDVYGTYKCVARNRLGSQSINITLKETDVPGEITRVIFDIVRPGSILFRFVEPSDDGGAPIIAYVVNYSTPEDYTDTMKEWPIGSPYLLENLRHGGSYTFKFAAKNSEGIGAWKKIDYVLMPRDVNDTTTEPNTLITKNVNITDFPDRYEIRWKVHDDYGMLKRYFVVTYFDDGRVKVEHQNGNITYPF